MEDQYAPSDYPMPLAPVASQSFLTCLHKWVDKGSYKAHDPGYYAWLRAQRECRLGALPLPAGFVALDELSDSLRQDTLV